MNRRLAWLFFPFLASSNILSQTHSKQQPAEEILFRATIVANNIQSAIKEHLIEDKEFKSDHQLPEDKQPEPKVLLKKDGSFEFSWSPGQQARYLMEDIRQGLHALQSAQKPRGLDQVALAGGREYWPKLRDLSCHESPGIRFYDLDGYEQYCPK